LFGSYTVVALSGPGKPGPCVVGDCARV